MQTNLILGSHVQSFFRDYLIGQRSVSPHTVHSYRDTMKLFLGFAANRHHKPVTSLSVENVDVETTLAFLDDLETTRGNCVATRNARLAVLHVFFRHIATRDPLQLALCQRVAAIPYKRKSHRSVDYLERDELEAILKEINRRTPRGRRDYALLSFFYNTGARVQEVLDLRAHDLQLTSPQHVRLWGKGRRERVLPLWPQTALILQDLLVERGVDPQSATPIFVNSKNRSLTRFGVRYILSKYVKAAIGACLSLSAKQVHPHTMRHTCAVHMLQAGVDIGRIASQLGHVNLATTGHYAQVSLDLKRRALAACSPNSESPTPSWTKDKNLLDWLQTL